MTDGLTARSCACGRRLKQTKAWTTDRVGRFRRHLTALTQAMASSAMERCVRMRPPHADDLPRHAVATITATADRRNRPSAETDRLLVLELAVGVCGRLWVAVVAVADRHRAVRPHHSAAAHRLRPRHVFVVVGHAHGLQVSVVVAKHLRSVVQILVVVGRRRLSVAVGGGRQVLLGVAAAA